MGLADLRHAVPVVLEHALLPVKPGGQAGLESAFAEAKAIIAGMPGFRRLTPSPPIHGPDQDERHDRDDEPRPRRRGNLSQEGGDGDQDEQ